MITERKVCIFTGSGFSKAIFNQKIQNEFLPDFLKVEENKEYLKYLSDDLVSLIEAIGDVEVIMSHYFNMAYSDLGYNKPPSAKHQREIIFFRMALAIYFRNKFNSIGIKEYEKKYRKLLCSYFRKQKISEQDLVILTTNYDLGFEKIIEDYFGRDLHYYPGFDSDHISDRRIPILKLHGSINWMENRGSLTEQGFKNSTRNIRDKNILEVLKVLPLNKSREFTLSHNGIKYSPIIVPFFFQKEQWNKINEKWLGEMFTKIRKQSFEYMVKADKLLFWGYGLPSADHHMFSFLYDVLERTTAECVIVDYTKKCCSTSDDTTKDSNLIKMACNTFRNKKNKLSIFRSGMVDYIDKTVEGKV